MRDWLDHTDPHEFEKGDQQIEPKASACDAVPRLTATRSIAACNVVSYTWSAK